jgi:hypothetical protein
LIDDTGGDVFTKSSVDSGVGEKEIDLGAKGLFVGLEELGERHVLSGVVSVVENANIAIMDLGSCIVVS